MNPVLSSDEIYVLLMGGAPPVSEHTNPTDPQKEAAGAAQELSTTEVLSLLGVMV